MAARREGCVIVIAGCGGAGKETVARLLYEALEPCAWVDMKTVIRVRPWEYGEALIRLGVRNAAGLARHYLAAGFSPAIVSGGLGSQGSLDLFLDLVGGEVAVHYVWLHAGKPVRDARRLERGRDDADRPEYLDAVDSVVPDPGVLRVSGGCYHRLDTSQLAPEGVLGEVLRALELESR
jgi:hypothetical protein